MCIRYAAMIYAPNNPSGYRRGRAAPAHSTTIETAEALELAAVRSDFCGLVGRWRLTQGELRRLLGDRREWRGDRVLPGALDARGETAVRLLLRLDRALDGGLHVADDLADWIRMHVPGSGVPTPLDAMADLPVLRAMVREAEARAS